MFGRKSPFETFFSGKKDEKNASKIVDTAAPHMPETPKKNQPSVAPGWGPASAPEAVSGTPETASGAIVEKRINERTLPTTAHVVPEGEGIGTPDEIRHLTEKGDEVRDILRSRRNGSALD